HDARHIAIQHVFGTDLTAHDHGLLVVHHAAVTLELQLLTHTVHHTHINEAALAGVDQLAFDGVGDGLHIDVLCGLVLDAIHEHHRTALGSDLHHRREGENIIHHLGGDHLQVGGAEVGVDGFRGSRVTVGHGLTAGQAHRRQQHHTKSQYLFHVGFLLL